MRRTWEVGGGAVAGLKVEAMMSVVEGRLLGWVGCMRDEKSSKCEADAQKRCILSLHGGVLGSALASLEGSRRAEVDELPWFGDGSDLNMLTRPR